jgi:collagen type III alpha
MPTLNLILNTQDSRAGGRPFNAPYSVQYIAVAGGGGSAGGDNVLEVGQAGSGGQVLTGSYCIQPFTTYPIVIGTGGLGGARTSTFPNYTGSNGENTTFNTSAIVAIGGAGGTIQAQPTSSFYAGNGAGASASFGNGGDGVQWTVNLPGTLPNNAGTGGTGGDYITSSYYAGGGAGFNINTLNVEFIAVAGGGAGGGSFPSAPQVAAGGGGGGGIVTGSYAAQPVSQSYSIVVGSGGLKGGGVTSNGGDGNPSSVFGYSASGGKGGGGYSNSFGGAAGSGSNFPNAGGNIATYGGGGGGTATPGTNGGVIPGGYVAGSGGDGELWLNGKRYGAGAFGAYTPGGGSTYYGTYGAGEVTGRGGEGAINGGATNNAANGQSGSVIIRYPGTTTKATGGTITVSGSYVYHTFTASGTFTVSETPDLLSGGSAGLGGAGLTGSNATPNTGGGAGASYYTQSGSLGGSGFFAIRYEGVIDGASGGEKIITDYYTYHLFTASGNFYSGVGNTQNKMINPCP